MWWCDRCDGCDRCDMCNHDSHCQTGDAICWDRFCGRRMQSCRERWLTGVEEYGSQDSPEPLWYSCDARSIPNHSRPRSTARCAADRCSARVRGGSVQWAKWDKNDSGRQSGVRLRQDHIWHHNAWLQDTGWEKTYSCHRNRRFPIHSDVSCIQGRKSDHLSIQKAAPGWKTRSPDVWSVRDQSSTIRGTCNPYRRSTRYSHNRCYKEHPLRRIPASGASKCWGLSSARIRK